MKNIYDRKEFKNKKSGTKLNEMVIHKGDVFEVRTKIEVPVSLVNAYMSKVKDESGKKIKELYAEMEIAEMIADYLKSFLSIENLPVSLVLGDEFTSNPVQGKTEVQVQTQTQPQSQTQSQSQTQTQGQGQEQNQVQTQNQPTSQVEKTAQEIPAQENKTQEIQNNIENTQSTQEI
jgi:hypothetical protein